MLYNNVLNDCIEREIAGTDYICEGEDRVILLDMIDHINSIVGTNIQFLSELDSFHISGSGQIITDYIHRFSSESVKGYLLSQLVLDRVKNCDRIILQLYLNFKKSGEYISPPNKPSPAHITARYDNAFSILRPKKIAKELLDLISSPRDAFYLPFTVSMLASWRTPGLDKLLLVYSKPNSISMQDVGLPDDGQMYYPSFSFLCEEIRFTAINGLRYYPTIETLNALRLCSTDLAPGIRKAAIKIIEKITSNKIII